MFDSKEQRTTGFEKQKRRTRDQSVLKNGEIESHRTVLKKMEVIDNQLNTKWQGEQQKLRSLAQKMAEFYRNS